MPHKVRIVQRAVVVRAADSPRIPTDDYLDNGYRSQGHEGGQESYPVGIHYVKTGNERLCDRWDTFLASWQARMDEGGTLAQRGVHVLYGGTDLLDWKGRNVVQLLGAEGLDFTTHRSRSRRNQFAHCTVYRLAFSDPAAWNALQESGLLARASHFDAPAPLPRGGKTDWPHGRLHPSQVGSQKDIKRCAHVITGSALATVQTVGIVNQGRVKADKLERTRAADPFTFWPEGGLAHGMPLLAHGEGI